MSVVSIVRQSRVKSLLFFLDDIWLYQYHKPEYRGVPEVVFEMARVIETKKDEFVSDEKLEFIKSIKDSMRKYD